MEKELLVIFNKAIKEIFLLKNVSNKNNIDNENKQMKAINSK